MVARLREGLKPDTTPDGNSGFRPVGTFSPNRGQSLSELPPDCYHLIMWLRRLVNLTLSAYLGGLIASYAIIAVTPGALITPHLRFLPFQFALGILIFTLPGVAWVAAIYRWLRSSWSPIQSYGFSIACGAVTGGIMLWLLFPTSAAVFGIGAFFGSVTALIWAGFNRYALPAF